jgi:hypothetical protein
MNCGEQAYLVRSELYSVSCLFKGFDDVGHQCNKLQTANSLLHRTVRSFAELKLISPHFYTLTLFLCLLLY